ncbi:hypothetical protein L3N51_01894 [Metallosphaera sp. J1]|nr:hypothetical protein [Metallosphaera javensis (ex Hofmann et al. 2022)]
MVMVVMVMFQLRTAIDAVPSTSRIYSTALRTSDPVLRS